MATMNTASNLQENTFNPIICIVKCFAVLSIISAHCSAIPESTYHVNYLSYMFLRSFGSIGVGVFFILSGFLFPFSRAKYNKISLFFSRKITTVFIPWFFCSTLVYLYVAVRKGGGFWGWVLSVLGYRSSFYYMTLLVLFFLLYFFLYKSKVFLIATILASFVSDILLAFNFSPSDLQFRIFLNPFHWCIFFTIGILINGFGWNRFIISLQKIKYIIVIEAIAILLIHTFFFKTFSYSSWSFHLLELLFFLGMVCGAMIINDHIVFLKPLTISIGKKSFSIYLIHMMVAGPVAFFFTKHDLYLNVIFRPFLVCGITYVIISGIHLFLDKTNWGLSKLLSVLIGER